MGPLGCGLGVFVLLREFIGRLFADPGDTRRLHPRGQGQGVAYCKDQ